MTFQIGQEVVVRSALGERSSYGRGHYYHGGELRNIPLGSRGIIASLCLDHYKVTAKGNTLCLIADELSLAEQTTKEESEAYLLEQALKTETKEEILGKQSQEYVNAGFFKKFFNFFRRKQNGTPFNPDFNVREEFVLWMEREFPEFRGKENKDIEARRNEVYEAAVRACRHGIDTTESCVQTAFENYSRNLRNNEYFYYHLGSLIDWIKGLSPNLPHNKLHYGTRAKNRRTIE